MTVRTPLAFNSVGLMLATFEVALDRALQYTSLTDVMLTLKQTAIKTGYNRKTVFEALANNLILDTADPNLKPREAILREAIRTVTGILALPDGEDELLEALERVNTPIANVYQLRQITDAIRKRKVFAEIEDIPRVGQYYNVDWKFGRERTIVPCVWRVLAADNPSPDMYISMRKLSRNGTLDTSSWRGQNFSVQRWVNMVKSGAIRHPLYVLKHEFSVEDIERAIPLLPYVLAGASDQVEQDKLMSTISLRKLIRRARKESGYA